MSKFLTPLICEKVEGTNDQWKLHEPLQYKSDIGGLITVPKDYITDFASTPWLVWFLMPKDGRYDDAAVVHDFLYGGHVFDREKCDSIFLEAMEVDGVGWMTRHAMWLGVRLGGGFFY